MTGDRNINYGTQGVGINKGTINYNETPVTCQVTALDKNKAQGDLFITTYRADLTGNPPKFIVAATGSQHIDEIYVRRFQQSGAMSGARKDAIDGGTGQVAAYDGPGPGKYLIEVRTSKPVDNIKIETFEDEVE
jgi:hypothetical protein